MEWIYALLTVAVIFGWPLPFLDEIAWPFGWLLLAANGLLAAHVWRQCSSREYSFFTGLSIIAGSLMSGCMGVTILYLPFVMAFVYVSCAYYSLAALVRGRPWAQERFSALVQRFRRGNLETPLNVFRSPTDPAQLEVDSSDPESILFSASLWDQRGVWNRAIAMYRMVKERWPEEHGKYAQNCIDEIERKRNLSQT